MGLAIRSDDYWYLFEEEREPKLDEGLKQKIEEFRPRAEEIFARLDIGREVVFRESESYLLSEMEKFGYLSMERLMQYYEAMEGGRIYLIERDGDSPYLNWGDGRLETSKERSNCAESKSNFAHSGDEPHQGSSRTLWMTQRRRSKLFRQRERLGQ